MSFPPPTSARIALKQPAKNQLQPDTPERLRRPAGFAVQDAFDGEAVGQRKDGGGDLAGGELGVAAGVSPLDLGRDELAAAPTQLHALFPDGGVLQGAHPELGEQDVPVVIPGELIDHPLAEAAGDLTPAGVTPFDLYRAGRGELRADGFLRRWAARCGARSAGARRTGDLAASDAEPARADVELGWCAPGTIDDMCADSGRWQSTNPDGYPDH
jgi:hypothetical protein